MSWVVPPSSACEKRGVFLAAGSLSPAALGSVRCQMPVWHSSMALGVPAHMLAAAAFYMLFLHNSSGVNPLAVTDCSYLAEKSSLIPLSLCPRQYPNSLLAAACVSLGLALPFPFLCGSLDYAAGHPGPLFPSPLSLPFAYKGALSGLSGSYCASVCKINVT